MQANSILTRALLIGYVLVVLISAIISPGLLETGDGISHYQHARFSWEQPELLLNHWAKPFFTLVSSPFAQLGFNGMILFNLILALGTAYCLMRISNRLGIKNGWFAMLCLFAAPVYFGVVVGGMTEVLFGFIMSLGIYLLLSERQLVGLIALSFLPYCRPEAYVILPFILLYTYLYHCKKLPLLLTATLVYAVIGYFALDDLLWYYTKDPYAHQDPGTYGFGGKYHFVNQIKNISGWPVVIFFLIGLGIALWNGLKDLKKTSALFLLFILPALAVFVVHSHLWWKGLNGSLGLIRVIATVIPLVGLIGALGFDKVLEVIKPSVGKRLFMVVSSLALIVVFFDRAELKIEFKQKEELAIEAAEWANDKYSETKVYYLEPLIAFEMDRSPFDNTQAFKIWSMDKEVPSRSMQSGEILLWDSHYGPQEGQMPLESPMNDPDLTLIKSWKPEPPIWIFGNRWYELHLFEKK